MSEEALQYTLDRLVKVEKNYEMKINSEKMKEMTIPKQNNLIT